METKNSGFGEILSLSLKRKDLHAASPWKGRVLATVLNFISCFVVDFYFFNLAKQKLQNKGDVMGLTDRTIQKGSV